MAGITKVNPATTTLGYEVVGKDVQFFTIDYIQDISTKPGPNSAQKAVLDVIGTTSTILAAGPLGNSNTEQTFMVEGTDTVVAATLQAAIRALGTVDGFDHSDDTVALKTLIIAH